MPAICEIFDAYGPDALTTIPQFILSPDFRITDLTLFLDLESVTETTSLNPQEARAKLKLKKHF